MIVSLFDYTGIMVMPWIQEGRDAMMVDMQHSEDYEEGPLTILSGDIRLRVPEIYSRLEGRDVKFLMGFPPCTDLAVSGTLHFIPKATQNPHFWDEAMELVYLCRDIGEHLGVPYAIENPVSMVSSLWREPDHIFDPYEYGGYLPEWDIHPEYPDYIAPRDAYPKKTCLWTGGGFRMPEKRPVPYKGRHSKQHEKLGGKSQKTKNIRSATPRGFARAIFEQYGR